MPGFLDARSYTHAKVEVIASVRRELNPFLEPGAMHWRENFIVAENGAKTKKFSKHFLIVPSQNFFQLRKRKFFCFAFLLTEELREHSILICKRAKIPSPQPPSFLPFCFSGFARFFCGQAII